MPFELGDPFDVDFLAAMSSSTSVGLSLDMFSFRIEQVSCRSISTINECINDPNNTKYNWLDWDSKSFSGKLINYPDRESIPENINEQLIVELYSK